MITLHAKANTSRYRVFIGKNILSWKHILLVPSSTYVVIYEARFRHTAQTLRKRTKQGVTAHFLEASGGEGVKTLRGVERIHQRLAQWECDKNTVLVVIGGGALGDVVGFVASTYLRGIRYINCPTTLLSQVDSCVGGKNAVNLKEGKNLVGTLWQPALVLCDRGVLTSLPDREWRSGLAEMIKLAALLDKRFFERLEYLIRKNALPTEHDIACALRHKIRITERDERDGGDRMLLNYGHTVGHAIEKDSEYRMTHGEAVAVGMLIENRIAQYRGILVVGDEERIAKLISSVKLPTRYEIRSKKDFIAYLMRDKKNARGKICCIVPKSLGVPFSKTTGIGIDVKIEEVFSAMRSNIVE